MINLLERIIVCIDLLDRMIVVCIDLLERIIALESMVDTIISTSLSAEKSHIFTISKIALKQRIYLHKVIDTKD